ncbi:hypothetical protein Dimus_004231 [Dionaea muscipula]
MTVLALLHESRLCLQAWPINQARALRCLANMSVPTWARACPVQIATNRSKTSQTKAKTPPTTNEEIQKPSKHHKRGTEVANITNADAHFHLHDCGTCEGRDYGRMWILLLVLCALR